MNTLLKNLPLNGQFVQLLTVLEARDRQKLPNLIGGQLFVNYFTNRRGGQDVSRTAPELPSPWRRQFRTPQV